MENKIAFTKMQALGNDFVVIDATIQPFKLNVSEIRVLADRRRGIGFDQLLVLEPSTREDCDFHYRIFNADGGEVGQCGNGARCIARFIEFKKLSQKTEWVLSTLSSKLRVCLKSNGEAEAEIAIPQILPEVEGALAALDLGNPHAVIQVPDLDLIDLVQEAQPYLAHPQFPNGVNVGFMQILNPQAVRLKVYERGVGPTLACGSGACAAAIAGQLQGLLGAEVEVIQPGGSSTVNWKGLDQPVYLKGPADLVFEGYML